jgi:hypothetical protein
LLAASPSLRTLAGLKRQYFRYPEIHCNGGRSPASGEGTWDSSGKKYAPTSGQRVYHCPSREVILEIPGNFVLKRLSSDHNLPVDLFPRRQPLIEVG